MRQVSVFVALAFLASGLAFMSVSASPNPALTEVRGPLYAAELVRCLPADMYQLIQETVDGMASMNPNPPPGTALPVDKMGWFAQTLLKGITGGRGFCQAYAMTTSMAISRFSEHGAYSVSLAQQRAACQARLRGSASAFVQQAAAPVPPFPMTVDSNKLVACLMTGSFAVEQTRLAEPSSSQPVKKRKKK